MLLLVIIKLGLVQYKPIGFPRSNYSVQLQDSIIKNITVDLDIEGTNIAEKNVASVPNLS